MRCDASNCHSAVIARSVSADLQHCPPVPDALTGAQYLPAHPSGRSLRDGAQTVLVGGHKQVGQCPPRRASELDGTDESAALGYDSFGYVGTGHWQFTCGFERTDHGAIC
jgi:hypothetical protein